MIIYFLLLILVLIFFTLSKDKKKALLLSFVCVATVASLRKYTVGIDTTQFYNAFTKIAADKTWNYTNFRYELGFYYLCKLLSCIWNDGQILIIFTSIFINFSVFKFIKNNSPDYCLSTILYIIMNVFFSNMNIMRQAIAVAIILLGFEFLKEKKYVKYIITVLIASLFHTVSFATILLLVFSLLPKKKIIYELEVIVAIMTFLFYNQFFKLLTLGFGYEGYAISKFGESNYFGSLLGALESLFIIIFLAITSSSKKKNEVEKTEDYVFRLLIISGILYLWFSFLVMRMNIFNRISSLYISYNLILIPYILEKTKINMKDNYQICKFVCLGIYSLSFLIISILRPEWHGAIPYLFFWQ